MSYSSLLKNAAKSTAVYSVSILASRAASFLLLPVYTRYLSPSDYGVLELLELTSFVLTTLIGIRFAESLFYFYAAADTPESRCETLTTSFTGSVVLGLLGGTCGFVCSGYLSQLVFGTAEYQPYFRLVSVTLGLSFVVETGFCYIRALDRPGTYVLIVMCRMVMAIILNVTLLVFAGWGVAAMLWSSLLSGAVMAVFLSVYLLRGIPYSFRSRLALRMFRYSFPLGLSSLGFLMIHFGDRFFLRFSVSLADIGLYALAYKLGLLVSYVQAPFNSYWYSQMFSLIREPQMDQLYTRVFTYVTLVLTFTTLALALFAEPLIRLLAPPAFSAAATYVPWIACAYLIRGASDYLTSIFRLKGKTSKEAQVTILGALTCTLGYGVLIPIFKVWGAVAATGIAFSVMLMGGYVLAQRIHHFSFEYRRLLQLACCAALVVVSHHFLVPSQLWQQVILGTALLLSCAIMLIWVGFFHNDELRMAIAWFKGFRLYVRKSWGDMRGNFRRLKVEW